MGTENAAYCYTNRKGTTYYLHASTSRGGKPRYVLKRSADGALMSLPAGYEVVESVNAQVSVRRARPQQIIPQEQSVVREALDSAGLARHRVEVKDDQITVFEPDRDADELAGRFAPFSMPMDLSRHLEAMMRHALGDAAVDQHIRAKREDVRRAVEETVRYSPVLRFRLTDQQARRFKVERMTYRGDGGWRTLNYLPLPDAVRRYVRDLGQDSFFELV